MGKVRHSPPGGDQQQGPRPAKRFWEPFSAQATPKPRAEVVSSAVLPTGGALPYMTAGQRNAQ